MEVEYYTVIILNVKCIISLKYGVLSVRDFYYKPKASH